MDVIGVKTKTEAIHLAISEFIRRKKLEGLKTLSGKVHIADRWQELEKHEGKAQEKQERCWRGHRRYLGLDPILQPAGVS